MKCLQSVSLLVILATACASPADSPTTTPEPDGTVDADGILTIAPGTADGPGITIAEALGSGGGQPLLVNGALFVDPEEGVLLCDAVAESFPPQCGGLRLEVRGLDLGALPGLEEANGVRWAEQVQLLGTLTPIDQ